MQKNRGGLTKAIIIILAAFLLCIAPVASSQGADAKNNGLLKKVLDDLNTLASEAKDPGSRVGALLGLANHQIMAGQREAGIATYRKLADELLTSEYAMMLVMPIGLIAHGQREAGDRDGADSTVSRLRGLLKKQDAGALVASQVVETARELIKNGDTTDARALLEEAGAMTGAEAKKSKGSNLDLLAGIAGLQFDAGDQSGALRNAALVRELVTRKFDAIIAVKATSGAGDTAQALKLAMKVENPEHRAQVLTIVAGQQGKRGEKAEAEKTLQEAEKAVLNIPDANNADRELARMAEAYAEIGLYGKATAALSRVKDATAITVITKTAAVAETQAAFGDVDEARKTASMIRDDSFRIDAFGKIALEQARKGDAKGSVASLQTAVKGIGGPKDGMLSRSIAMAWTGVANALVKAGKMQEAKEALKKAQDAFKNVPASEASVYIQVQIGKVQAALLQTDAARTTADSIKHPGWKATVLQAAAQEQAKSGKAAAAYGWAGKLGQPFERSAALTGVAMGLLEQGK